MAEIFPRWMNRLPRYLVTASAAFAALAVFVVGYAFSPAYTDVGYMPRQPIPFSHRLHAGELSVDCRYCHASVEISPSASLPPLVLRRSGDSDLAGPIRRLSGR